MEAYMVDAGHRGWVTPQLVALGTSHHSRNASAPGDSVDSTYSEVPQGYVS
ncbi:MAG: hypothetical protein U0R64_05140 [Candidatus Nanopelagicales bacterium]